MHELRVNDELLSTMQQRGFSACAGKYRFKIKIGKYITKFWRNAFDIREAGHEMPIANFVRERFKSRGAVSLPKGETLKIEPHLFKGFCEIKNVREECIVRIKSKTSWKERAEVTIEKRSELIDRYPWVILLAYIIIIYQRHHASHLAL